jgi:hypothetical protein
MRVAQLERAVARLQIAEDGVVRRVDVAAPNGRLQVAMELAAAEARAVAEAERLFAFLWYDAFGDRTARHQSRLI